MRLTGPDDLPRSPTGRVPQWVVDQAAGVGTGLPEWPALPTPAPVVRRRAWPGVVALVLVIGGGLWWADGVASMPGGATSALPGQGIGAFGPAQAPAADIVALADAAHMSTKGRELFYGTQPVVLDAADFAGRCDRGAHATGPGDIVTVGCYDEATNSIILYGPPDPRLYPSTVETAAHEMLHAAWAGLTDIEQGVLTPLMEAEVAALPADDPIHAQITSSVGDDPQSRPSELFAYVGTQVWHDAGLPPTLEVAYARVIDDRRALVALHTGLDTMFETMSAQIQAASEALTAAETAYAQDRAQYNADAAAVESYRKALHDKVAEVAAMPAAKATRLQLAWVWWDGTDLPMAPASTTLAAAQSLLDRDDAALPAREADLAARAAATGTEGARLNALIADLTVLESQITPGA
ncbi:MAG TPA: hypothetical protein VGK17_11420 [Propionicimonas sp.]|jgi:hypothetical protein